MRKSAILLSAVLLAGALLGGCAPKTTVPLTSQTSVDEKLSYDYDVKEIWCENNGKKIYGQAYIPKTDGKSPLVITSHGLGSNLDSGASYAKKYAPKGFAVYTFDFCGGSNSNNPNHSDGTPSEMSVMTEVSDLEAVLETAKSWDFADSAHIYLQGGSQGGLVSAITGVRHQDEIAGMILLYPAFGMVDFVRMYDPDDLPDEIQVASMTVGKNFITDLYDYDVREDLHTFAKPVLVIQGSADDLVLPEATQAAVNLLPDAEYHVIEGADHGFSGKYHDEATQYATDFLYKHIR